MEKLSDPMIRVLRHLAEGGMEGRMAPAGTARTVDALKARWLIADTPRGYRLTINGRNIIFEMDRASKAAAESHAELEPEPECREGNDPPHPIGAPGCVLNGWGDSGPSVRLTTTRSSSALPEATDPEVLQLLAMLDAGAKVARRLYQVFAVSGLDAITTDPDAVNRAARDAVRFALARQTFKGGEYTLTAEPVHLDAGNGHSACGFPLSGYTIRHRVTSDPAKVTHERCRTT